MTPFGYCERTSLAFWAEPLNAVTNAAFIAAALASLIWLMRRREPDRIAAMLVTLVGAIGIGSFLFHTMPGRATLLADVIPIQLFAFLYFGVALHRFLALRPVFAGLATLGFVGFAFGLGALLAPLLPAQARGSSGYAAFALALVAVGAAALSRDRREAGRLLLAAGAVFALSLTLRTLDGPLCRLVPVGTHFLWHLLNAATLALLLRAAILHPPSRRPRPAA